MRRVVGRVVRPHGIRGEVVVEPATDQPAERFAPGQTLHTDSGGVVVVVASRPHAGRYLLRCRGVRTRDAAEALRDTSLSVEVTDVEPGDEDSFDVADLVGLAVRDLVGTHLGVVRDVELGTAQDLLLVDLAVGGTARVPFVAALVPVVAVADGWVQVDPPPGLLSLEG